MGFQIVSAFAMGAEGGGGGGGGVLDERVGFALFVLQSNFEPFLILHSLYVHKNGDKGVLSS